MLCRTAPAMQRGVTRLSQHRFGILHHRRWTSSSASHRCGGVLCGDAAGPLSSARRWCTTSEDGHVTLETTSSSRRPSSTVECEDDEVRSRRAYYNSCKELRLAVDAELRAEVARDMVDGESAIPPLAPGGWRVQHDDGTAFFTMHRRWEGSRMRNSPEEARFRSVNDEQHGVKTEREPPTASTVLRRGRDGKYVRGSSQPDGAKLTTAEVVRSSMDVTIMAHFRTQDLSLRDPTVDICEWSLFDVVVAKEDPRRAAASRTISEPPRRQLVGQQKVWDQHECIWIRLANVNSELRIRSLQVLSRAEARTLSEFAAMGKPEAGMMEVMAQLRQMEERRLMHRRRTSSSSRSRHNDHRQVHLSPSAVPTNTSFTPSEDGSAAHVLHGDTTSAAERLLCTDSGTSGDYARALCYGGPYISELSKELQECLMSYVVNEVGITPEVAEYICQMKYFMEQSEYVGWLATLRQLASVGL